jgi:hypothetical protein
MATSKTNDPLGEEVGAGAGQGHVHDRSEVAHETLPLFRGSRADYHAAPATDLQRGVVPGTPRAQRSSAPPKKEVEE